MEGLETGENRIPERYLAPEKLANRWIAPNPWAIWFEDLEVHSTSSGISDLEDQ